MGSPIKGEGKWEMHRSLTIFILLSLSIIGLALLPLYTPAGYTRIVLTDESRGRRLLAVTVPDGEPLTLTWRNSQFGLTVTEIFHARGGLIIQDRVTFADPSGPPPPRVSAADVADLYHTGGAFDARGLSRPFSRIVYRIGEIGNPQIRVKNRTAALKQAAGFGGRVILTASAPRLYEFLF